MTSRIRIQCINKTDRQNPHERIKNVGRVNPDGSRWKQSVDHTIKEIENGVWEFYVEEKRTADVIVAVHNGHKYIKTKADGINRTICFRSLSAPNCRKDKVHWRSG